MTETIDSRATVDTQALGTAFNRVQTNRFSTAGARPTVGSNAPGVLYANWADKQLGVLDNTKTPQDLVAVRFFSTLASYAIGDYVAQGGVLYRARVAMSPGAFNGANWDKVVTIADLTSATGGFLPLAGGQLTGPLSILMATPVGSTAALLANGGVGATIYLFNAYPAPGGTGWKTLNAGCSGFISFDQSSGQITFLSSNSVAAGGSVTPATIASIDAAGNLIASGDVRSTANLIGRGATYPSYNNAGDFLLNAQPYPGIRYLQWASNWYDAWFSNSGMRSWVGFDGTNTYNCMSLDGGGNLSVRGQAVAAGAIISGSTVQGANVNAYSGTTWGNITGGYLHSTGDVRADGSLAATLDCDVNRNLAVAGSAQVNGNEIILGNLTVNGSFTIGSFTATFATVTDTLSYNHFVSSTFYGHDYAFGWNGKGTRHRVDGGDQGYLTRSDNMYAMHFAGNAVTGQWDGGVFAWTAYTGLREAQDAAADIATIRDLHEQIRVLAEKVATLEAKLA